MFDVGFWELFLIAVVALVVVGPERLPKLVRVTGLWIGRANSSIQSIRNEISQELRAEELKQALKKTVDLDEFTMGENSIASPSLKKNNSVASNATDSDSKDGKKNINIAKPVESDPIEKDNDNG